MAPVESDSKISNTIVLSTFAAGAVYAPVLLGVIVRFLFKVEDDLPPAYHTRRRSTKHTRSIWTFGILAGVSLLVNFYNGIAWRVASYHRWAQARSLPFLGNIWSGWYAKHVLDADRWDLGRWYREVNVGREADELMVGSSSALWWQAQNAITLIVFSVFVGLECRHRNIPQYIAYSTVLLAQAIGTATAASVFFIVLIYTHVPLKPSANSQSTLLTAHPVVMLVPALWALIYLLYLPWLTATSFWTYFSLAQYQIIPLLLCALAQPNYLHKIESYTTNTSARQSYTAIFRVLSWASIAIHVGRSASAILATINSTDELNGLHYDYVWNTHSAIEPSRLTQAGVVISKILGTLNKDPIVSYVAWDVLLTQFAFSTWAATRGLDVWTMFRSAGVFWSKETSAAIAQTVDNATSAVQNTAREVADAVEDAAERTKKTAEEEFEELVHAAEAAKDSAGHALRASRRKVAAAIGSTKATSAEAQADPATTKKTRGRPRKDTTSDSALEASSKIPGGRRSAAGRASRGSTAEPEVGADADTTEDPTYEPSPAVAEEVRAMNVLPEQDETIAEETEAAAVTWGLFVLGGLGTSAAAVLGAEVGGGK